MTDPVGAELSAEDAKLVTLARGARARVGAPEGAAVRDGSGRSYTGATVDLPSLQLSALGLAVAQAVSSGADALEAAVVVTTGDTLPGSDLASVHDLGGTSVLVVAPDGTTRAVVRT